MFIGIQPQIFHIFVAELVFDMASNNTYERRWFRVEKTEY